MKYARARRSRSRTSLLGESGSPSLRTPQHISAVTRGKEYKRWKVRGGRPSVSAARISRCRSSIAGESSSYDVR